MAPERPVPPGGFPLWRNHQGLLAQSARRRSIMEILGSPLITALVSGVMMFIFGFAIGQRAAWRRIKLYERIREV
jgi:hypothetical protein